jgi:hypothetical protein
MDFAHEPTAYSLLYLGGRIGYYLVQNLKSGVDACLRKCDVVTKKPICRKFLEFALSAGGLLG